MDKTIDITPETKQRISELIDEFDGNEEVKEVILLTQKMLDIKLQELNHLMKDIYENALTDNISDSMLSKYVLMLSSVLFSMGDSLEITGLKSDLSSSIEKQVFNDTYLANKSSERKWTVADLNAMSEIASREQTILNAVYARAYKVIKYKLDAGFEMLNSLKKIVSKRMQELQIESVLSKDDINSKVLLEGDFR